MASERRPRALSDESSGISPGRGRLTGRRVLVVGGGQRVVDPATDPIGNGRAAALLFAREGARVAVADREVASAEETVRMIAAGGGRASAIQADITREADVRAMVEEANVALGGLDGLLLNVGVGVGALNLEGTSVADWDMTLAVNLRGPMLCCREALPVLDDGSSIVFVSSIAGLQAGSRLVAYDASKAGIGGLMRHVALEGARRGIRANTVVPGLIDTPLGRAASAGRASRDRTPIPFGRMGTGWEVAHAALYFMSGDSVYVTGQQLVVDGGLTGI